MSGRERCESESAAKYFGKLEELSMNKLGDHRQPICMKFKQLFTKSQARALVNTAAH